MITQTGKLNYGVEFEGAVHTDFELRLPTIADNIAGVELVGIGSNLKVHVAMMARTLVRLGNIPAESITFELLSDGLVDDDFDVLAAAERDLKKKRKESIQPSLDSGSPSPSLVPTESPKSASAA